MDGRESHTGVRRRQHGTGIPCRANPGSGNRSGDTRACRREQGRNEKHARGTDSHGHRPDPSRRVPRPAAGRSRRHIRRAGLRRARGARSPGTPAGDPRRRHPSRRSGRLRQPLVRHGRRRTRLVRRGTGIRARSGRGIRRRTFVQHARNPDRTGTPRRTGSDCRHGIRGSGARKISKNRAFPGKNPETASDTAATTRATQTGSMDAAKAPATGALFPSTPRSCANRVHRSSRSCASSGSYWLPPPAETQPRRPATRGRCRTLHAMRPLRRTVPHAGHRTRRRAAHRPGTLHPLLRLRERVRLRCPHIPHALCSRPGPEFRAAETARDLIITLIAT